MWRRAARVGLLLCAVIQWCSGAYGAFNYGATADVPTKTGTMIFLENVIIGDFATNKQAGRLGMQIPFARGKQINSNVMIEAFTGRYCQPRRDVLSASYIREQANWRPVADREMGANFFQDSWCFPVVPNSHNSFEYSNAIMTNHELSAVREARQNFNKQISAFKISQGALGDHNATPQPKALIKQCTELHDGCEGQNASQNKNPPLGRRIAELFGGLLVGFPLASWGVSYIDKDRPFLATCLIGGGILVFATGMFLWWAIQIPATWGWPI